MIEYLKTPPSREMLIELISQMGIGPRDLLREKGTPYQALGLGDKSLSKDALIEAMLLNLILINRPVVVTNKGAKLCRPSELVFEILEKMNLVEFTKEDGEIVNISPNKTV